MLGPPLPIPLTLPHGPYSAFVTTSCVILGRLFSLSVSPSGSEEGEKADLAVLTSWGSPPETLLFSCLSCILFSRWELAAVKASMSMWPGLVA